MRHPNPYVPCPRQKAADHAALVAWSCNKEALGGPCCKFWCGNEITCTASFNSAGMTYPGDKAAHEHYFGSHMAPFCSCVGRPDDSPHKDSCPFWLHVLKLRANWARDRAKAADPADDLCERLIQDADEMTCYASTTGEFEGNRRAANIREAAARIASLLAENRAQAEELERLQNLRVERHEWEQARRDKDDALELWRKEKARAKELEQDAARYRWLRNQGVMMVDTMHFYRNWPADYQVDKAIAADARKAAPE